MEIKEMLKQYIDLKQEVNELQNIVNKLEEDIDKLQKRIDEIENGEVVADKVYGGAGGKQGFIIKGMPTREYKQKKNMLYSKKIKLEQRKADLEELNTDLIEKVGQVEKFIANISDSHTRRIIRFRFVDGYSWNEVADRIGGGNTEDGVRMTFERYIKRK